MVKVCPSSTPVVETVTVPLALSSVAFNTAPQLKAPVAIADIDGNGSMELFFAGDNDLLHAWNPITDTEAAGWPIDLGNPGISEPIIIDLDNDGDLEVMCLTDLNEIHLYHHDGTSYENFSYVLQEDIHASPAIGDLDNDGDYEIIVGTSSDLRVIDIAQEFGDKYLWSTYRGNHHRDGYFDVTLASASSNENFIPTEFILYNNYPNPFNPWTIIKYSAPVDQNIELNVYDLRGGLIKNLLKTGPTQGVNLIKWDATDNLGKKVPAGVYLYQIKSNNNLQMKKMVLLK